MISWFIVSANQIEVRTFSAVGAPQDRFFSVVVYDLA
jgi:hypothetical protein